MRRNFYIILLFTLTLMFFNLMQASGQVFFMKNPNIGMEAKDFTLNVLNAGTSTLNDARQGKKALIFFWATWCPHCREALSEITKRKQEIDDKDIQIILVDVGEDQAVVNKYLQTKNIYLDVFLDEDTTVAGDYGVIGIPTFFFVGEDGIVRNVLNSLPQDIEKAFYGSKN